MRKQVLSVLKPVLLPILERQWLLERLKYVGQPILDRELGNDVIGRRLADAKPSAIGKIGGVELGGLRHYLSNKDASGKCDEWGRHAKFLYENAGVYPQNPRTFERFCKVFAESLESLDILAVWFQKGENAVRQTFAPKAIPVSLTSLEPYFHPQPWSQKLAGKRVLVVTPFASTVETQYRNRRAIWRDRSDVLPDFDLETLRCPLSAGLTTPIFADWFLALDAMQNEMSKKKFDIALIGAGGWGVPLASHAKSIGRSGIHLGGPTQLLFGIRGGRWDSHPIIRKFMNDAWIRPTDADRPENFRLIENGCYW